MILAPVTPPTALGAKVWLAPPGSRDASGRLPGINEFAKLKTLKMAALGSTVTRSWTLIGHAALMSMVFNQVKFCASGGTDASCGITQFRVLISANDITCTGPDPGHCPSPTRQWPLGVRVPAK